MRTSEKGHGKTSVSIVVLKNTGVITKTCKVKGMTGKVVCEPTGTPVTKETSEEFTT